MATPNPILAQAEAEAASTAPTTAIPNVPTEFVSPVAPAPEGSSISVIESAIAESNAATTTAVKKAEVRVGQADAATAAITDAISQATVAQQTMALTADTATLQEQNANTAIFNAAGGHEKQIAMMTEVAAEADKLNKLTDHFADIMDDEHTGLSLLDGIINGFRAIGTRIQIKNTEHQLQGTTNAIAAVDNTQEKFIRQNSQVKQTVNSATIAAHQQEIAALNTVEAHKSELANAQSNAQAVSALVGMRNTQVSQLIQGFRLEGEVQARELAAKRQAFAIEEMAFNRKKWETQLPALEVNLEQARIQLEDSKLLTPDRRVAAEANYRATVKRHNDSILQQKQLVAAVQRGQAVAGLPVDTDEQAIVWQLGRNDPTYNRLLNIGAGAQQGIVPVIGSTPSESIQSIALIDTKGTMPKTKATEVLDLIQKEQVKIYQESGITPNSQAQINADIDATSDKVTADLQADIRSDSPYAAPPMGVMHELLADSNIPFYDKVLKGSGIVESDPQVIVNKAMEAAAAGVITAEEAAEGITEFFEAAIAYNSTNEGGFKRFGLDDQTTFKTTISRASTFSERAGSITFHTELIAGFQVAFGDEPPTQLQSDILLERRKQVLDLTDKTVVQNLIVGLLSSFGIDTANDGKEAVQ